MAFRVSNLGQRLGLAAAGLAGITMAAAPAAAQFGGFSLPSIPRSSSSPDRSADGCPKGKSKSAGSAILGSVLGQAANRAAGSTGIGRWIPSAEVADQLTNAIACRLDPEEQKQAAEATLQATRGDAEVGTSATWTSATRENVSGTSTITARNDDEKSGMPCIMVTDVIIVNGEETTASKRMCKPAGSARYSLLA